MNKTIAAFALLIIVVLGAWYFLSGSRETGQGSAPALNADVYPLYSGATWSEPVATTSPDVGPVVMTQALAAENTMNIAAASTPFSQYYEQKLTAEGWMRDNSREAGGPGAGISLYRKSDDFIEVAFTSLFHNRPGNAPVQCPCDVTLRLASGSNLGPSPAEVMAAARTYTSSAPAFSIVLPTSLASSSNDSLWSVDANYSYTAQGPGKEIAGVKFTIPKSAAAGTNLASDTYLSVEHLSAGASCDAASFLAVPGKSVKLQEGAVSYTVASSTDAAVGNRYEEWVYARTGTAPCIAVRYYIHYAAIENFPPGKVQAFDKAALIAQFDDIRRTLRIAQQ